MALWMACKERGEGGAPSNAGGSSSGQDEEEEGLFSSSSVTGRHKGSGFPFGLPLRSHGQLDHSAGAGPLSGALAFFWDPEEHHNTETKVCLVILW